MSGKKKLYLSILQVLKERIIDGTYAIGTMMPTEREIEAEFQVSKITVRRAMEILETEGYVEKKSGKGTTVINNTIFNKMYKDTSFITRAKKAGRIVHKEKTNISKMKLAPNDELYQYFKDTCTRITRMYYLDGEPYIYFTHYLPGNLTLPETIKGEDDHFSIYMTLFRNHYQIETIRDEFYVDYPKLHILESLNLKAGPVLGRKRMAYTADHEVIEITYAHCNTRVENYSIEYQL